jgi:hypothetical protein
MATYDEAVENKITQEVTVPPIDQLHYVKFSHAVVCHYSTLPKHSFGGEDARRVPIPETIQWTAQFAHRPTRWTLRDTIRIGSQRLRQ